MTMNPSSFASLVMCSILLASPMACTRHASPDQDTTPAETVSPADARQIDPPADMMGLPLEEQRAIMVAAGCKQDDTLSASACTFCPVPEGGGMAPVSEVEVFRGASDASAVVLIRGCGQSDGAEHMNLIRLEKSAEGAWSSVAQAVQSGVQSCQHASGHTHSVCVTEFVRYGLRSRYYQLVDWSKASEEEGELVTPVPPVMTLLEVAERSSCEFNYTVSHDIEVALLDPEDATRPFVRLDVETFTGPFQGDISSCPEDNFSGEFTPVREAKTTTTTYRYANGAGGLVEVEGKSSYLSLGAEYEDLMEQ